MRWDADRCRRRQYTPIPGLSRLLDCRGDCYLDSMSSIRLLHQGGEERPDFPARRSPNLGMHHRSLMHYWVTYVGGELRWSGEGGAWVVTDLLPGDVDRDDFSLAAD